MGSREIRLLPASVRDAFLPATLQCGGSQPLSGAAA